MIVELHNKLGQPQRIKATRVVLRLDNGDPIAVAISPQPLEAFVVHRGDGDEAMERALRVIGINETLVSDMQSAPKPPGQLWTPS
jgi:hypothetical protein